MGKRFLSFALLALFPSIASAHEVYVLTPTEIHTGLSMPSFSEWQTMFTNIHKFMLWGFIAALVVFIVFFVSISRTLERWFDPVLATLPRWAPLIGRVTIGLSLLSAAYYNALFGPELPLTIAFGNASGAVRVLLVVVGLMLMFGFYTRIAALVLLSLFVVDVSLYGTYMLTYANYFGEILVLLLIVYPKLRPYTFPLLRICFGTALLYASFYAKILHNDLALQVASLPLAGHHYGIAHYLGFEPHFLVLGAAIIEVVIGLFFILGIEIRFTSLFLLFWLSLSLIYFGEVVWPHLILIGIPIAFICYGYDKYSLEGYVFKRAGREPIL